MSESHIYILSWRILTILLTATQLVQPAHSESTPAYYHNASLLWGAYRPNLYFGTRPQLPQSLLLGLMWIEETNSEHHELPFRHSTTHRAGLDGYGWSSYDPRTGGAEVIYDEFNKINLTLEYAKDINDVTGMRWGLRLNGMLRENADPKQKTRVFFYIAAEDDNAFITCQPSVKNPKSYAMHTICTGNSSSIPTFELEVLANPAQEDGRMRALATLASYHQPAESVWPLQSIMTGQIQTTDTNARVPHLHQVPNIAVVEMTYTGDFDSDITFTNSRIGNADTSAALTRDIDVAQKTFESRFAAVYSPKAPFNTPEYTFFSQQVLSDLLAGIGYAHGKSLVAPKSDNDDARHAALDLNAAERGPYSLLSTTPSRPDYPRGHLFDEGFHLQIVADWDMDLALSIIVSWFNLTDSNGWIAREQILGAEARSKLSSRQLVQFRQEVTPLTIYAVLEMYIDRLNREKPYHGAPSRLLKDVPTGEAFIRTIYPALQSHYEYYRSTLAGNIEKYQFLRPALKENFTEGYRWRGRDGEYLPSSGLDDYPRATRPSLNDLHVDALSWITIAANAMRKAAIVLGLRYNPAGDAFRYDNYALEAGEVAVIVHWSDSDQAYCDATLSSSGELKHVCHKGYVSLIPFMTDTIFSQSLERGHVAAILDLMTDPGQLWTAHGVKSLSRRDKLYDVGEENRWRGPIWVNMNYLLLMRLLSMAQKDGKYKKRAARIYTELRKNIVRTVFESWKETGTVWEHYNPDTGIGQGASHFTGSTSLVVRIMAMPDLEPEIESMGSEDLPIFSGSSFTSYSASSGLSTHSTIFLAVVLIVCIIFRKTLLMTWRSVGRMVGR